MYQNNQFCRYHIQVPVPCLKHFSTDKECPPTENIAEQCSPTTQSQQNSRLSPKQNLIYDSLGPDRDQHHYKGFYAYSNSHTKNPVDEHSYMAVYDSSCETNQRHVTGNALSNAAYYDEVVPEGLQNLQNEAAEKQEQCIDEQCYYNISSDAAMNTDYVPEQYAVLDPTVTGFNRQANITQEDVYELARPISDQEG